MSTTLPSIIDARLPASYERAKQALVECSRIDECQEWADKAEALASYAKQAKDDQLRVMADRIQARAIRRCGELLKTFDARGGDRSKTEAGHGSALKSCPDCQHEWLADLSECPYCNNTPQERIDAVQAERLSQRQAANKAGLSEHQQLQAVRVANVPAAEFEALIESQKPPTVKKLAEIGKHQQPRPLVNLEGRDPKEFAISTNGQAQLRQLAEFAGSTDAAIVIRGAMPHERKAIRHHISVIDAWLDQLVVNLVEEK